MTLTQPASSVLLIRHGRSSLPRPIGLLDRSGVERWRLAYDEAGIAADDRPPAELLRAVERADVIAASDLPRAIASARALAAGREVVTSPLFREIALPIPTWFPLRAPYALWDTLVHLRWGLDILRRCDTTPAVLERARAAVSWCRDACGDDPKGTATLAIVTHGVFRRQLARQLLAAGWIHGPGVRSYEHWSAWRFDLSSSSFTAMAV